MENNNTVTKKGFLRDFNDDILLPITRAELILDKDGKVAFHSDQFLADNGLPGLITADERQLIHNLSGNTEQNLADLYNKLNYINNGLIIDDKQLNFYNTTTATPIEFVSAGSVKFTLNNNQISADVADTIADKNYVDSKFNGISAVAIGALIFGGVIKAEDVQNEDWTSNYLREECANHYYKVVTNKTIAGTNFESGETLTVRTGDTLIVHKVESDYKFIHIPSGDEPITSLSIFNHATPTLENALGHIKLTLGSGLVASTDAPNTNEATIKVSVHDNSTKFLESTTTGLQLKISTNNQGILTDGLIDNTLFSNFVTILADAITFESIENSLKISEGNSYYYGSDNLKNAINVTI